MIEPRPTDVVLADIAAERERSKERFLFYDDDVKTLGEWNKLIGEWIQKANEGEPRKRYVQLGAIVVAAIEAMDRNEAIRQASLRLKVVHSYSVDPETGRNFCHHYHPRGQPCDEALDPVPYHLYEESP